MRSSRKELYVGLLLNGSKEIIIFSVGAELSLNSVNSVNSENLINHQSMNWAQFKDPVSHMCLAGTVGASWSLTQKMASSSPFTVMTNIFVTELSGFFSSGDFSALSIFQVYLSFDCICLKVPKPEMS